MNDVLTERPFFDRRVFASSREPVRRLMRRSPSLAQNDNRATQLSEWSMA
jgi:hypothetical protein